MDKSKITRLIKQKSFELGFDYVGISQAKMLTDDAKKLENWLNKNHNGQMAYMENHFDKRVDPRKLLEDSKSVVSLLYNYHTKKELKSGSYKIAKYAFGEDYHFVVREKLNELLDYINETVGSVNGRGFVDSAPILDRAWARESGNGWIGKNSMLINKSQGSDFFIGSLLLDLDLEYDGPIKDYCGSCTKCIDSCPTEAILPQRTIDSNRCISYLTIELKEEILPNNLRNKMEDWIFGCDICQDVCPWNRFSVEHKEERFHPSLNLLSMSKKDWVDLEEDYFKSLFKKSAVKRTKYVGLKRNIEFIKQ